MIVGDPDLITCLPKYPLLHVSAYLKLDLLYSTLVLFTAPGPVLKTLSKLVSLYFTILSSRWAEGGFKTDRYTVSVQV